MQCREALRDALLSLLPLLPRLSLAVFPLSSSMIASMPMAVAENFACSISLPALEAEAAGTL